MTTINEASRNTLVKVVAVQEAIDRLQETRAMMLDLTGPWNSEDIEKTISPLFRWLYQLEAQMWRDFFAMAIMLPHDKLEEIRAIANERFFEKRDGLTVSLAHYLNDMVSFPGRYLVSDDDELRAQLTEVVGGNK